MDERPPIRKIKDGISLNTETAYLFHAVSTLETEQVESNLQHRLIVQALYLSRDGHFFVAFWNLPRWDPETLGLVYEDDARVVDATQARQWVSRYCPTKVSDLVKALEAAELPESYVNVTVRMDTGLRNHLAYQASMSQRSISKICLLLMEAGMTATEARKRVSRPAPYYMTMVDGGPAVDEFERACVFEDPDDQALAGYAEQLFGFYRFNFPGLLPFAAETLHRLIHIVRDEPRALCFARWLALFYRTSYDDVVEQSRRNPPGSSRSSGTR